MPPALPVVVYSDYDVDHLSNFPYLAPHTAMQLAQNSEFICSELVSLAYERAGVEITDDDRPASLHAPADIAHCDALDYVVSLHEGERIADAALNEWHHRQPSIDPWIELEVRAEALSSPRARRLYHYYRDMAKRGRARCE